MNRLFLLCFAFILFCTTPSFGQSKALTFEEAERQGIPFQHLDSLYKSAIHDNSNLAVFINSEEQAKLLQAYSNLLQELGKFLKANNYRWERPTRGANRIYFSPDGRIDYFLFHFPEGQLAPDKEEEFNRLLSLFIQDYKFEVTAGERFAQCSPVKYSNM